MILVDTEQASSSMGCCLESCTWLAHLLFRMKEHSVVRSFVLCGDEGLAGSR